MRFVRKGEVFIKDEEEVVNRVGGVEWGAVCFDTLILESDEQKFSQAIVGCCHIFL